jgi:anthranilate phosphoribosyltransferase
VLEALGVRIDLSPEDVGACIDEVGFGFMFAPRHHAATRFVIPVRKELAVRTIFNFLGPLTNPAGARRQVVGVSDPSYIEVLAGALARLGCDRALVVSSADGLDEMSTSAPTHVVEVNGDELRRYDVSPGDVGLTEAPAGSISGGDPAANAAVTRAVFDGATGPDTDLVLLNAGAAIYAGGQVDDLAAGVELARDTIASGAAARTLADYVRLTRERSPATA